MKNLVRKIFTANDTWVAPAGVTNVTAKTYRNEMTSLIFSNQMSFGRTIEGDLYAWGVGSSGALGDNTTTHKSSPVLVVGGLSVARVGAKTNGGHLITTEGAAYGWGTNTNGQIGDNTVTTRSSPTAVVGGLVFKEISVGGSGGLSHQIAVDVDGAAWGWGANGADGKVGNGTNTAAFSSPVLVVGGLTFAKVATGVNNSAGLTTDGRIYCWGNGGQGGNGQGNNLNFSSPVLVVGGFTDFVDLSCGGTSGAEFVMGLRSDGSLYAWGSNTNGQLGDGTTTAKSSPVLVVGGLVFAEVSAGRNHAVARTAAGVAYTWGNNDVGQLGDGTVVPKSSPVLVVGGLSFIKIQGGGSASAKCGGITADGDLYTWGSNTLGSLGDNTIVDKSSPVLVVGGLNFAAIQFDFLNESPIETIPGDSYDIVVSGDAVAFGTNFLSVEAGDKSLVLEYFA